MNHRIFNRIKQKIQNEPLVFISSNRDVGKTTYFVFWSLYRAIEYNEPFHLYCRYAKDVNETINSLLLRKTTFSNRKNNLLDQITIKGDTAYCNGKAICQAISINTSNRYKSQGNQINAVRAIFDEVLPETNNYCNDEIKQFSSVLKTMSKGLNYQVICLYNNVLPTFIYKDTFDDIAKFYNIKAKPYKMNTGKSIADILEQTVYKSIMKDNKGISYHEIYKDIDVKGYKTIFKIYTQGKYFKVKKVDNCLIFDSRNAHKKSKHKIYQYDDLTFKRYKEIPTNLLVLLTMYKVNQLLYCNKLADTIFVRMLPGLFPAM